MSPQDRQQLLKQYRTAYEGNNDLFWQIRGFTNCFFCQRRAACFHQHARDAELVEYVCRDCLIPKAAQAPAPEALQGETIDVPFTQGTQKLQVTVKVYKDSGSEEFEFLDGSNVQKIKTYADPTIRRIYFVPPSRTIRLFIKNLEVHSLVLKTVKVDVNLDAGQMTRVMLASNEEEVLFNTHRPGNTDRESLKILDKSDKLLMILSFQEVLEQDKHKRKREGGSALGGAQLTLLDNSLRSLCLLAQDT
jgi:hypothetical protein